MQMTEHDTPVKETERFRKEQDLKAALARGLKLQFIDRAF